MKAKIGFLMFLVGGAGLETPDYEKSVAMIIIGLAILLFESKKDAAGKHTSLMNNK